MGKRKAKKTKRNRAPRRRNVDVTPAEIREALEKPADFGYSGDLPLFETWALGPVVNMRDATILAQANWAALERELERHPEWEGQWEIVGSGHWSVGWVDHLAFQAIDDAGNPTEIFRFLKGWFGALAEYPIADNTLYSEFSEAAYAEGLQADLDALESRLYDDLPHDWQDRTVAALVQLPRARDESDVPYHPFADLEEVASQLGYLDPELAANPADDPTFIVLREVTSAELVSGQLLVFATTGDSFDFHEELTGNPRRAKLHNDGWRVDGDRHGRYEVVQIVTPRGRAGNPIGPGLAATLGSWGGNALASITLLPLNLGVPAGVFLYWTLGTIGAGVGGYLASPEDRKRRVTTGAMLGNLLFPILGIGAAVGGFVGGRHPDPEEVQKRRRLRKEQGQRFNPGDQNIRAIKRRVMR